MAKKKSKPDAVAGGPTPEQIEAAKAQRDKQVNQMLALGSLCYILFILIQNPALFKRRSQVGYSLFVVPFLQLLAQFVTDSFFANRADIGLASCRAGNVIGGGDFSENRLIPDCVKSLMSQKAVIIRNPNSVRPWQHVLEPVFSYILMGAKNVGKS